MKERIAKIEDVVELEELRIGNLLEYKGKIVHVTMLSLDIDDEYQEIIGFCELGKNADEHADWNRAMALDLKRVLVTEAMLIELGFTFCEKQGINSYYRLGDIGVIFYDGACELSIIQDGAWDNLKDFYYVHTLQNLYYFLEGKELKYKP